MPNITTNHAITYNNRHSGKPGSSYLPGKSRQAYCSYCSRVTLISKPIHFIIYGGRHLISMQEIQISMREGSD